MSWDLKKDSKSGSKMEFTKFPVGVTHIRVLDKEPHIRWIHWIQSAMRSANCPGKGCPICEIRAKQKENGEEQTYNMARRYAVQVLNRDTNQLEIMEQGITFFEDLRDLLSELEDSGKTLGDVDLKVKRRGKGKDDTSYRIDIHDEYELTEDDQKLMKDMVDLKEFFMPHTIEQLTRVINGEDWTEVMTSSADDEDEENIEIA